MAGPLEACDGQGTCYRLRDRRVVERRDGDGGDWVEEVRLSDDELEEIDTGCSGGHRGVLASVAISGNGMPVASLGAGGVLVRAPGGGWDRVPVNVES